MPYRWTDNDQTQQLSLWPNRSLSPKGFVTFISITAFMFLIPILAVLGSLVLWMILPHILIALGLAWYFLRRNTADGALREELTIARDQMTLHRENPRAADQDWSANPYWVRVEMDEAGGPVPNYVTLCGSDREVEIGAFLSPEERIDLFRDLQDRLRRMDTNAH